MLTPNSQISHLKYRPDIDGLRALAVLAVVTFHAFPNAMKGGFIGVDVFFVISGYLISTILFENLGSGSFSFCKFYSRRISRIFPALILVLMVSFIFGWFTLLTDEYIQFGKYMAAGAAFVSNFALWADAGYFDNSAETKPLLHLWSLGIEEQFYIIWPLVLWFCWKQKFNLLIITILVITISLVLNLKGIRENPVGTFYSPQTRFWELLAGSLLAWATIYQKGLYQSQKSKIDSLQVASIYHKKIKNSNATLASTLSITGLAMLTFSFWRINKDTTFPGEWALIPVVGSILIIAAGPKAWVNRNILSRKITVWFGLISFPLYLWHWPLLSFARIIENETPSGEIRLCLVALSIALSWLTYKTIERPIRSRNNSGTMVLILTVLMLLTGILGCTVDYANGYKHRLDSFYRTQEHFLSQTIVPPALLRNKNCEEFFPEIRKGICVLQRKAPPTILLVGDSHAIHFYSGLEKLISKDENIGALGGGWGGNYLNALNPLLNMETENQESQHVKDLIYRIIERYSEIHTIVLSCSKVFCYKSNFSEALSATLAKLKENGKKAIFVIDIPEISFDPKLCGPRPFTLSKKPKSSCVTLYSEYITANQAYRMDILEAITKNPTSKVFDTSEFLCNKDLCFAVNEGDLLYRNGGTNPHLSENGSDYIGPHLLKALQNR